jgi:general nucleoside transport system ATP-binding protein
MEAVRVAGIGKYFSSNGVTALKDVSFALERGEIRAVAGENGAGKSTLMHILSGLIEPTAGEIEIEGKPVTFASPADALSAGIGMVHQTPRLILDFSVLENCMLGAEGRGSFLKYRSAAARLEALISEYGFDLDPAMKARDLSLSQKQKTALLTMLYRNIRILLLDEPTAALAPQEVERLFDFLERFAASGGSCILITHRLPEVMRISRKVAVIRKGELVADVETASVTAEKLSHLMVGGELKMNLPACSPQGDTVLYEAASVSRRVGGRTLLDSVSFALRSGEVLGFVGMREDGLEALEGVVSGFDGATGGAITLSGTDATGADTGALRSRGARYVPARKLERGLSLRATVSDNLVTDHYKDMSSGGVLDLEALSAYATRLAGYFDLGADIRMSAHRCSGGMLQKIILSRELSDVPTLLILAEPETGLDLASRYRLEHRIVELRNEGTGIILFSTDLDEALALSDRIAVLYAGRIVRIFDCADFASMDPEIVRHVIGEAMLGIDGCATGPAGAGPILAAPAGTGPGSGVAP